MSKDILLKKKKICWCQSEQTGDLPPDQHEHTDMQPVLVLVGTEDKAIAQSSAARASRLIQDAANNELFSWNRELPRSGLCQVHHLNLCI